MLACKSRTEKLLAILQSPFKIIERTAYQNFENLWIISYRMDHLLPRLIPITIASRLAGLSPSSFREQCLQTGTVATENGRVVMSSLAAYLGAPIEPADYLRAERSRDRAREAQRAYSNRRTACSLSPAS